MNSNKDNSSFSLFPTSINSITDNSAPSLISNKLTFFESKYSPNKSLTTLYSFGSNEMGQLGQKQNLKILRYSSSPIEISTLSNESITNYSLGGGHVVAVNSEGQLYSWGACACGQLGIDDASNTVLDSEGYPAQPFPKQIIRLNNIKIKYVACGDAHTLAISDNGDIYSWGGSGCGQLGHPNISELPKDNDSFPYLPFPKIIDSIQDIKMCDISCGKTHSVAIDNSGNVYSWGGGASGQLGVKDISLLPLDEDSYPYQPLPCVLSCLKQNNIYITKAVCGEVHTLLLSTTGELYSFGSGAKGQLGLGPIKNLPIDCDNYQFMPVPKKIGGILQNKRIVYISSGDNHCMVIDSEGKLYGWGFAKFGQIGMTPDEVKIYDTDIDGNPIISSPVHISKMGNLIMEKVSCGENHTIVLTNKGIVFGFGLNLYGQLGISANQKEDISKNENVGIDSFFAQISPQKYVSEVVASPKLITSLLMYNITDISSGGNTNIIKVKRDKTIREEAFSLLLEEKITDFVIDFIDSNNTKISIKCHKFILISNSKYFYNEIIENGHSTSLSISNCGSYYSFKTILHYLYVKELGFLTNCESEELSEYLKISKILMLTEVENEIQSKIKNSVKKYISSIKSIYDKDKSKSSKMNSNIFFSADGNSIIILNEKQLKDISSYCIKLNNEDEQQHNNDIEISKTKELVISSLLDDGNEKMNIDSIDIKHLFTKSPSINDLLDAKIIDTDDILTISISSMNSALMFFNNKLTHDITIKMNDDVFYANKIILSCASMFFETMLTQNMKESNDNEITISDFSSSEMYLILMFFYCNDLVLNLDMMLELLKGFDLFQVRDYLKSKIQMQIQSKINVDNVSKIFSYAHQYNLERLKFVCLYIMQENYNVVVETKGFEDLQKEQLLEVMRYMKYKY